jgi:hypothetical protein
MRKQLVQKQICKKKKWCRKSIVHALRTAPFAPCILYDVGKPHDN